MESPDETTKTIGEKNISTDDKKARQPESEVAEEVVAEVAAEVASELPPEEEVAQATTDVIKANQSLSQSDRASDDKSVSTTHDGVQVRSDQVIAKEAKDEDAGDLHETSLSSSAKKLSTIAEDMNVTVEPINGMIEDECQKNRIELAVKSEKTSTTDGSNAYDESTTVDLAGVIEVTDDKHSDQAAGGSHGQEFSSGDDGEPPPMPIIAESGLVPPVGYYRFGVAILTLTSILLANMNRQAFNQGLTEMVLPEDIEVKDENDNRPAWTNIQTGELKSAFSLGYAIFMIPIARMGEIYGTKWIVFASTFGSGFCSVLVPYLATHDHFTIMKMSRFAMGVCQAGVAPALFAILARWLSEKESNIFLPLIKGGVSIGLLLGSGAIGLLSWQTAFYVCGGVALVLAALWVHFVSSVPEQNRLISIEELRYIQQQMKSRDGDTKSQKSPKDAREIKEDETIIRVQNDGQERTKDWNDLKFSFTVGFLRDLFGVLGRHPLMRKFVQEARLWVKIFINWPVIGIMLVKWTMRLSTDAQTQYLADFFKKVHKLTKGKNSIVNCVNYAIQGVLTIHIVWFVNYCLANRSFGLNKTGIRRLFQSGCSFGMAASFMLITFDMTSLDVSLMGVILLSLTNILQSGADSMMPYDLSPTYCGTIMGVANSFANSAGIVLPTIVRWTVGNDTNNIDKWGQLFWVVSGLIASGGVIFLILVKAKIQPFDPAYEQSRLRSQIGKEQRLLAKNKEQIGLAVVKKGGKVDSTTIPIDDITDSANSTTNPKLKQLKFQEWRAVRGVTRANDNEKSSS